LVHFAQLAHLKKHYKQLEIINVSEMMSVQGNPYAQIQYKFYHCCASRLALKYIKIHKNKLNTTNTTIFGNFK
jgi:hypothetical protein